MGNIKRIVLWLLVATALTWLTYPIFQEEKTVNKDKPINSNAIVAPSAKEKVDVTVDKNIEEVNKLVIVKEMQKDEVLQQPQNNSIPKINVQLDGVFLGEKENSGYALISYNGVAQQIYIAGGRISEGVVLKSLFSGGVVIDNHGKLETYYLQKKDINNKDLNKQDALLIALPDDGPPMDSSPPPLSPPIDPNAPVLSPAQSKEYIPPPPEGGLAPGDY